MQEVPRLLDVSLKNCCLQSLSLQSISALEDLVLIGSSLESVALSDIDGMRGLTIRESSFRTLSIRHDSGGSAPDGLTDVQVELSKCSVGSLDLQGIRSIERLAISECDLSKADSIWRSLAALRSLKYLLVNECTGLRRLPHEIGGIKGLEGLYLDLRALDSAGVGKCAEGSGDVDPSESFRFPETLKECCIFCKESLVSSICGRWFEKCRQGLDLEINGNNYIVTEDYQLELKRSGEVPEASRQGIN